MSNPLAGQLTVGSDGRIIGPAAITYNTPFPCVNGSWGSGAMTGVIMHTMVGSQAGTISWFNNPQAQASAQFGVGFDGAIHQFGPIGQGWIAWHAGAANATWYGIEHEDGGDPSRPLTDAQLTASAQLTEMLTGYAGIPLQVTNSPSTGGLGTHSMGGSAWGGHACPGDVRAAQRDEVIRRAQAIRGGGPVPQPPAKPRLEEAVMQIGPGETAGMSWNGDAYSSVGFLADPQGGDVVALRVAVHRISGGYDVTELELTNAAPKAVVRVANPSDGCSITRKDRVAISIVPNFAPR
jgi:hypothetical protein